jgi:alkanesulfonate monooxygenase SsuD/methylene tetrahydromethanopterin reductase-like flavin-dependent oxidoreductase (luciferase family)
MHLDFGIFDHLDRGNRPVADVYKLRFALAEKCERAGFYAFHVAEHHGTTLSCAPSPNVFLAALSQRTRRLRFAPLVYVLPFYEPLRLIEELCMLDHLSEGRLEIGVGKGIAPFEHVWFGRNPLEAMDRYKEVLEIVLRGLTEEKLSFKGEYYKYHDVPMVMKPLQQPRPPLWYGVWYDPNAAVWPAKVGAHLATILSAKAIRPLIDRFREEWAKHQPGRPLPKIAVNRTVVVAETDKQATDLARKAHENFQSALAYLWHVFGAEPAHFPRTFEGIVEKELIICGSPARVRAEIERQARESGINYFIGRFAYGDLADEHVHRSLDLFISEVVPHFRPAEQRAAAE